MKWDQLADEKKLERTVLALEQRGINVVVAEHKQDAFQKALGLIPRGAEVMDLTSTTLDQLGISKEIQESGKYSSVKKKIQAVGQKEMRNAMRQMSAAVDYAIGSVHAVTEQGQVMIASSSGSQLAPYVFGAEKLIWVVGTQKIVKDLDAGFQRIREYSLPLEDARARKVYGVGSGVNKILIVEREITPNRITVVFVKENLGF